MLTKLIFYVNGRKVIEDNPQPKWTLLYYLRIKLHLTGSKEACGEGGCGACTVMLSRYNSQTSQIEHVAINACLTPVCAMHGLAITTIEGLGSVITKLHPIQERIASAHGSQCGFCTPGMVMSMYALLRNSPTPTFEELERAMQGNLCRCTGYRPIIDGFRSFCAMGEQCCKRNGFKTCTNGDVMPSITTHDQDNDQELIFPPELKLNTYNDYLHYVDEHGIEWHRPQNLDEMLTILQQDDVQIVAGNTEFCLANKKCRTYIDAGLISELYSFVVTDVGVRIGAGLSLNKIDQLLEEYLASEVKSHKTKVIKSFQAMLKRFGSQQIRNVASLAGNIITASPISDLNPILVAAGAVLNICSAKTQRTVNLRSDEFFVGYRCTKLSANEVLLNVLLPFSEANQHFYSYKQSRRRDDDIAIVNCAISVKLDAQRCVEDMVMCCGGMDAKLVVYKSLTRLIGIPFDNALLEEVYTCLLDECTLRGDSIGGMVAYRKTLPLSFFHQCFNAINNLEDDDDYVLPPIQSAQYYQLDDVRGSIRRPIVHQSAFKHATGEAIYVDDLPHYERELFLAYVLTRKSHALIKSVDYQPALEVAGVWGYVSADDLPAERNVFGCIVPDEEIIVTKRCVAESQIIGAILAEDALIARRAAELVRVVYEELTPIVSIEEAIANDSYFEEKHELAKGCRLDERYYADNTERLQFVEGEARTGMQDHFCLETQGCMVIPKEEDEMEIIASTQDVKFIQMHVARALNIPHNRIIARTKRIGGGFGSKETRGVLSQIVAAIAARKSRRPIRAILSRAENMGMIGGRHAFKIEYKVGFDAQGGIHSLDERFYSNCGHSLDYSSFLMQRAMHHADNSYTIANVHLKGLMCKTNLPSNTAFRGFGCPQAMFAMEYAIRDVAERLKLDPVEVALRNLHVEGDLTCYNQPVTGCTVRECYTQCLTMADYYKRAKEVAEFNRTHRWRKRGLSVTCTRFGAGYGMDMLQQGGALVMIYVDGSVALSHGGIEMGQGLQTKMIQVASDALGIGMERIYTHDNSTDKVPNTTSTSASISSDLNGMAILQACETLKARLKPLYDEYPNATWNEIIGKAYAQRISLSATGFYCAPTVNYNMSTNSGTLHNYFTFGAACSEVMIDCRTGDHCILRTDIVMDIGRSLNPAIDVGQIEGAFMQGYGLYVLEESMVAPDGMLRTKGPGNYKLPSFGDVPREFNVALLRNETATPRAMYSSKAVGEPPLALATSVFFAIREAINAARRDAGVMEAYRLQAPATAERIRMGCADAITQKVNVEDVGKQWNVIP